MVAFREASQGVALSLRRDRLVRAAGDGGNNLARKVPD